MANPVIRAKGGDAGSLNYLFDIAVDLTKIAAIQQDPLNPLLRTILHCGHTPAAIFTVLLPFEIVFTIFTEVNKKD